MCSKYVRFWSLSFMMSRSLLLLTFLVWYSVHFLSFHMFYREKSGLAEVRQAIWLAFLSPADLAYPDRDHVVAESVKPRCGGELKCVEQTNVLLFVREVRNDILGEPLSACQHGELEQSPRVVVHCKSKRPEAPQRISKRDSRRLYICRSCLPALRQATPCQKMR